MLREQLSQGEVNDRFAEQVSEFANQDVQASVESRNNQEVIDSNLDAEIGRVLQEKYGLSYNPVNVTRGIGSTVLADARSGEYRGSEAGQTTIEQEFAHETDKDLPDTHEYRTADAQRIIANLLNGDAGVLSSLPPLFQEALSVRMNQRINELNDGTITEGYFKEEVTKMVQVASNGMWATDFPVAYEDFMKTR